ncbi:MAG: baseplate J/gp47 family protein [Anaerosacchariphilus sp.]
MGEAGRSRRRDSYSYWNGPGTVKLVLVDGNGKPANAKLVQDVYNYIVSPNDRSARLLPTGTAELTCAAATTVAVIMLLQGSATMKQPASSKSRQTLRKP